MRGINNLEARNKFPLLEIVDQVWYGCLDLSKTDDDNSRVESDWVEGRSEGKREELGQSDQEAFYNLGDCGRWGAARQPKAVN